MEKTNGLVIKQSDYGDGNRMLTIFTEEFGIVKAVIYGVKKAKSRQSAASQFLSWAEFSLYFGKGEVATVNSISSIESFYPIYEDLEKLSLSSYLAEITYFCEDVGTPNRSLLRLLLNTFFALAYSNLSIKVAKTVYELRLSASMGYRPYLENCSKCKKENPLYFSIKGGGVVCEACNDSLDNIKINENILNVMRYILSADEKKVFSFKITKDELEVLSRITEQYIIEKTEKEFASLEYLKKILT